MIITPNNQNQLYQFILNWYRSRNLHSGVPLEGFRVEPIFKAEDLTPKNNTS